MELLPEGLRARNILLRAESDSPPIESVASCAALYGFVNFTLIEDEDGTVRSVPPARAVARARGATVCAGAGVPRVGR
jgi:hypothetical protein